MLGYVFTKMKNACFPIIIKTTSCLNEKHNSKKVSGTSIALYTGIHRLTMLVLSFQIQNMHARECTQEKLPWVFCFINMCNIIISNVPDLNIKNVGSYKYKCLCYIFCLGGFSDAIVCV